MGPSWPPEGPTQKSDGEGHVVGERAQVVVVAVVILRGGGGGRRGAWRERKQLQQPWLLCGGVWALPLRQFDQIKRGGNGWGQSLGGSHSSLDDSASEDDDDDDAGKEFITSPAKTLRDSFLGNQTESSIIFICIIMCPSSYKDKP